MNCNRDVNIKESKLSKEEWEEIGKTFEFMEASNKAREGQPPDTAIEFECPICKGRAVTSYSSYNGHPRGQCDCGMNFMV